MKNGKSLVEKAKEIQDPRVTEHRYSDEEIELALAWVAGDVTLSQAARVKETSSSAMYAFLACALRQWMNEGKK